MAQEEQMKIFWSVFGAFLAAVMVIVTLTRPKFSGSFAWRLLDLSVGGIFIYAGVLKVLDPVQFANDIDNYKTLPWFFSVCGWRFTCRGWKSSAASQSSSVFSIAVDCRS